MIASALQTQLIARNCDRAQLFAHMIGHAFVNRSADRLLWLLFYLLLHVCLRETKHTASFGDGTLDRKGSG